MTPRTESKPGFFSRIFGKRASPDPIASLEALHEQEREASLAVLRTRQGAELWEQFVSYWPIGVGLLLGAAAPLLRAGATMLGQWCMVLVFPFVLLAARPEIQTGGAITHALPAVMLYAQFPIEGWLARFILKRRVKFSSVTMQVLLFHFLGIAELFLLRSDGWLHRLLGR